MEETIELDWQGPIGIDNLPTSEQKVSLEQMGIYAWVYPSPPYDIPGIYFGMTKKSIAKRLREHLGNVMLGEYPIPDHSNPDVKEPELRTIIEFSDYLTNINRLWDHINETEFYFAVNSDYSAQDFLDIERVLIDSFNVSDAVIQGNYFSMNKDARGSGKKPSAPMLIKNSGSTIITDAVGERIIYQAKAA